MIQPTPEEQLWINARIASKMEDLKIAAEEGEIEHLAYAVIYKDNLNHGAYITANTEPLKMTDMILDLKDGDTIPPQPQPTPRPSEALYLFAGWITSMDDPPIGNPVENPGDWAKLVETFCKHNNLEEPDCKFPGLSHPPEQSKDG